MRAVWMSIGMSLLLALGGWVHAATATTSTNTTLHDSPGGQVTATLLAHTLLEVGERQGGWYKVTAGGRSGWLRSGSIRFADRKDNETVFSGLWGWLNTNRSGRASSGTTTVGIRGLDAGDIEQATPNHQAVDALEKLRVTEQNARQFAARLPLQSQSVSAISKEK